MADGPANDFQLRYDGAVAEALARSPKKIAQLAAETGIERTTLSKIRYRRRHASWEQGEAIFRACNLAPRAMLMLCTLGLERVASPGVTGFLDGLLTDMPDLIEMVANDEDYVDPRWGRNSLPVLYPYVQACIDRSRQRLDVSPMALASAHPAL